MPSEGAMRGTPCRLCGLAGERTEASLLGGGKGKVWRGILVEEEEVYGGESGMWSDI